MSEIQQKALEDVLDVLTDFTANGSFEALRVNVKYYNEPNFAALVRTTDLEKTPFIPTVFTDQHGYEFMRKTALYGGEIILASVGSVGKVFKVPDYEEPMTLAPNTYLVKFNDEVDNAFMYQYFRSPYYLSDLYRIIGSTTLLAINKGNFRKIKFPCFPKAQQKRIAEILTTLDETIEQTEALITKMQQVKAGLMHDLFTRGVTPDGHLRPTREQVPDLYKESPLGWIPKEWEVEKLGEILRQCGGYLQTGPFGSQLHAHEYQIEGIPVVMPQDINSGLIGIEQIARINEERAMDLARHRMQVGDIVIARRGDLSRAAAIRKSEQGWVCGTGCFLLRLGQSSLSAEFAACVYRQDFVQRQIAGKAVGTTMPSLNNSVMAGLLFPFCDEEEQARIVERLEGVEQSIRVFSEDLSVNRQLKHGLMHDLLTGHVRVLGG